ncbi:8-amino-7-oxononanoate synthase [Iodobacter fluviatilis]|uniref:8-amino-7-oxononanoate synthase n=1 Tax=Iodobacter fluviatilis TaxID=537 RepID=A0A377Q2U4_9NEIS|nr:8-amino-7-oxononanoate synthase [Iodobacter fluviatilis]TCU90497.1 8-amino-7-oxononanoate synthase [Iodobacter fluviatilis]STQ89524.1 8-amino-7-oxononanoate synthase [Iodobacter fluviatilis]
MPFAQFSDKLAERQQAGLLRSRRQIDSPQGAHIQIGGRQLINFCSNDYLGLANHPSVVQAAQQGAADWGVGSGAAHLLAGHFAPHQALEDRLAAFVSMPAALGFSTGYMANLAVITALVGRGDAVFADKLNHASLNDAVALSRADFKRYPHQDMAALERLLAASTAPRKLIVADAVFSMDGDIAPVAALLALAERYDAWLFLDDAHGFGVLGDGRGTLAEFGISSPRIIYMATLGKAAGVSGAFVAGEQVMCDWLLNTAHSYVYTTAMPPLLSCAMQASLDLIETESWRRQRLAKHIAAFRAGLQDGCELLDSNTAIQLILLPDNDNTIRIARALFERGIWVGAIRPPTVPTPRLRITLSAAHSDEDIAALIEELKALLVADI